MKDDKTIIDSHFLKSHEARSVRILAEYEKINSELETQFLNSEFAPRSGVFSWLNLEAP